MSQKTKTEPQKPLTPWQKRMTRARVIGRAVCVVLILVVCGNVTWNIFRLLDSFNEKEPSAFVADRQPDDVPMFPLITFDPEGQWELSGLSTVVTSPLMPMPETVTMLGSRNDRDGSALMQLFEYQAANADTPPENRTQPLLDYWSQQGWKCRSLEVPLLASWLCECGNRRCHVQLFFDDSKCYVLVCYAPHES